MKTYTEEDLRKAFQAGIAQGGFLERDEYAPFFRPLDEDDYINSLKETVIEEDKVSFTYSFLRRKIDWEQFCDLTGIDYYAKANGYEVKDNEVFYITESKAKQFNLI
jgi:NADH:ubiquinone oxidoreductase subunit C